MGNQGAEVSAVNGTTAAFPDGSVEKRGTKGSDTESLCSISPKMAI